MSIWWANERPSSSDSEDSEPENVEWPKNNYTLIHITIAHIIIVLATIFLCQLQLKVEVRMGQFKIKNERYEREQKSFIHSLQSCEKHKQKELQLAEEQFNALNCKLIKDMFSIKTNSIKSK